MLEGTRVAVADVVRAHRRGTELDEILIELPSLRPEQVHAALLYYFDNRAEVDALLGDSAHPVTESRPAEGVPAAPFQGLDLTDADDFERWEERVYERGRQRMQVARERLAEMGVVRDDGTLASEELPHDMLPESKSSMETG